MVSTPDDGPFCIACGEYMDNPHNHHCKPAFEIAALERLAAYERSLIHQEALTESELMEFGFDLMHREDEEDETYNN